MIPKAKKHLMCILIPLVICAVIAVGVYSLHKSAQEKMTQYEEDLAAIPVTLTVTTPTGEPKVEVLDDGTVHERELLIFDWVYTIFTEREPVKFYDVSEAKDFSEASKLRKDEPDAELSLAEYVKDVQGMNSQQINKVSSYSFLKYYEAIDMSVYERYYAYGITSLDCDPLFSSGECEITWYEGYDESVFESGEAVCLIPNSKARLYDNGNGEAVVSFYNNFVLTEFVDGELVKEEKELEVPVALKIVGTYTGGDWNSVYCPLSIVLQACIDLESVPRVLSLSATLADNSRLDEFREKMSVCFLEPSPDNVDVPWGYFADNSYHELYPLSLDIDDEALSELPDVGEEVQRLESIAKIGVIALSVIIAGIPVGCLVIFLTNKKNRKPNDQRKEVSE